MKKALLLILLLIICLVCLGGTATAEFYKYTDKDGNTRYTDDLSRVPENQRPGVKSYKEFQSQPQTSAPAKKKAAPKGSAEKKPAADTGLDAQATQIKNKQEELDKEFQALMKEKARLVAKSKDAKTEEETIKYNQQITKLNQDIANYDEKLKKLNSEIEAYNAKISEKNTENK